MQLEQLLQFYSESGETIYSRPSQVGCTKVTIVVLLVCCGLYDPHLVMVITRTPSLYIVSNIVVYDGDDPYHIASTLASVQRSGATLNLTFHQ